MPLCLRAQRTSSIGGMVGGGGRTRKKIGVARAAGVNGRSLYRRGYIERGFARDVAFGRRASRQTHGGVVPPSSTTLFPHMKSRRATSRHKRGANRPSDTVLGFAYLRFAGVNGRSGLTAGSRPKGSSERGFFLMNWVGESVYVLTFKRKGEWVGPKRSVRPRMRGRSGEASVDEAKRKRVRGVNGHVKAPGVRSTSGAKVGVHTIPCGVGEGKPR